MTPRRRFPIITVLFIGANVLAAFWLLFYPELAYELGFRPDKPHFQTALTSLFLHENVLHLLGNMIFLAAVGAAVELATGSLRFASVYLVSGLVGVLCHYVVVRHAPNPSPLLGASGCIAGCAAYYSVRYPGLRVAVAPKLSLSVAVITIVWIVLQAIGAVIHIGDANSHVSFWAHLGGFATGLTMSVIFRTPDLGHLKLGHEVLEAMNHRGPAAVAAAAHKHLTEHPGDPVALRQLARASAQMDDHNTEADTILELMDKEPEEERAALLGRLVEIGMARRYSSAKRTMLAEKLKGVYPAVSKALLMTVLQEPEQDAYRPEAMLALAEIQRNSNPEKSAELLGALLKTYPLHPCVDLARKRGWIP